MQEFTEREVQVIQKQREVLKEVLYDPSFNELAIRLRDAIKKSLAASAEVLM